MKSVTRSLRESRKTRSVIPVVCSSVCDDEADTCPIAQHSRADQKVCPHQNVACWDEDELTGIRCIDYTVKIRVNPQQTGVDTNVKHSMVRSSHMHM